MECKVCKGGEFEPVALQPQVIECDKPIQYITDGRMIGWMPAGHVHDVLDEVLVGTHCIGCGHVTVLRDAFEVWGEWFRRDGKKAPPATLTAAEARAIANASIREEVIGDWLADVLAHARRAAERGLTSMAYRRPDERHTGLWPIELRRLVVMLEDLGFTVETRRPSSELVIQLVW